MKKLPLALAFLVGLTAGLGGETLLLLQRQCRQIEESLRADFTVLLFPASEIGPDDEKVVEEKLLALPDVDEVRYVSKDEALNRLKAEDPGLVSSVAWLGENPLNSAFEVRLLPRAFGHIAQWLDQAQAAADWSDIRYKQGEGRTILQAQFYSHLLNVALSSVVCLVALMAICVLWLSPHSWEKHLRSAAPPAAAVAGGALGAVLAALLAWPLRFLAPWWSWPPMLGQAALILIAAVAGWSLCAHDY